MNQIETFRKALAAVQVAHSLKTSRQFLSTHIDYWEEWTGHSTACNNLRKRKPPEGYRKPTKQDTVPFDGDDVLFRDADFENIVSDLHETLSTGRLETEVKKRLREAVPPDICQDLSIGEQWDARCIRRFLNDYGEVCRNNLPRLIVEDCTFSSSNNIEIPQGVSVGADNTQAHLRPEDVLKFNKSLQNMAQAFVFRDVLKSLDFSFYNWVQRPIHTGYAKGIAGLRAPLSGRVRGWCKLNPDKTPWEAPVGSDARALSDLALQVNNLEREQQEDPGYPIDPVIALNFPAEWQEPAREPLSDVLNTTGEFTYLRISRIPDAKEFNGLNKAGGVNKYHGVPVAEFRHLIQSMDELSGPELAAWHSRIMAGQGSFEQRDRFSAEYVRILNSRAEFKGSVTVLPPMTEPYDLDNSDPVFIQTEDWQLDETGRIYENFQDDPNEDILDDIDGGTEFLVA